MKQRGTGPASARRFRARRDAGDDGPLAITILMYATATMASVSRLAAATILPAFLLAGSFMLVVLVHATAP